MIYDPSYVANKSPTLDPPALPSVAAQTDITLTASWQAEAAETYLSYEQLSQTLVTRREASGCRGSAVSTIWHTPAVGTAYVWLVLRDSRGGIATQMLRVQVEP